ncbi:MAG: FAD-binding oxidoreductase [Planctomyces sp.]|nr:FAD-binding oxidoreductase [Planctomyces sp.]
MSTAEKSVAKPTSSRLFEPFFDTIDAILFVPATASGNDVRTLIGNESLRFPLLMDSEATLAQHVLASTHAPASSRFGPYCDNIVGMNWVLPNGNVIRLGERVAKTTTGYDVFRFMLHGGSRFGYAKDFVIRLRPRCKSVTEFRLIAQPQSLCQAATELIQSCWMHWIDAIDLISEPQANSLRVLVQCPEQEAPVFRNHLSELSARLKLACESRPIDREPEDGIPDLMLKATPNQAMLLGTEIHMEFGVRTVACCYPGIVHCYLNSEPAANSTRQSRDLSVLSRIVQVYSSSIHSAGGEFQSRHFSPQPVSDQERCWIETFFKEAGIQ